MKQINKDKLISYFDDLIDSARKLLEESKEQEKKTISVESIKEIIVTLIAIENDILKGNFDI